MLHVGLSGTEASKVHWAGFKKSPGILKRRAEIQIKVLLVMLEDAVGIVKEKLITG